MHIIKVEKPLQFALALYEMKKYKLIMIFFCHISINKKIMADGQQNKDYKVKMEDFCAFMNGTPKCI